MKRIALETQLLKPIKRTLTAFAVLGIFATLFLSPTVHADPLLPEFANEGTLLDPNFDPQPAYDWNEYLWFKTNSNATVFTVSIHVDQTFSDSVQDLRHGDYLRVAIPPCNDVEETPVWDSKISASDVLHSITPNAPYPLDCILPIEDFYNVHVGQVDGGSQLVGKESVPGQGGRFTITSSGDFEIIMVRDGEETLIQVGQDENQNIDISGDLYVYFGHSAPTSEDDDGPTINPNPPTTEEPVDPPDIDVDDDGPTIGPVTPPTTEDPIGPDVDTGDPTFDDKVITPEIDGANNGFNITGGGPGCSLQSVTGNGMLPLDFIALFLAGLGISWSQWRKNKRS